LEVSAAALVVHVGQLTVPVAVTVPPVSGDEKTMLVTVPPVDGLAHFTPFVWELSRVRTNPFVLAGKMPSVPAPVPVSRPPSATAEKFPPVPPCASVTAALLVRIVLVALGSVNVLAPPDGPENTIEAVPSPPLAEGRMPLTSVVRTTAPKEGFPPGLPCSTVVVVPSVPRVASSFPLLPITNWPATKGPRLFVTVPPAATLFHVPSPYQTVELDAPVPPFRLVTGRLPVTPPAPDAARLMAGRRAAARVPLDILEALSAFVVADGANAIPFVVRTVVAHVPAVLVASPVRAGSAAHPKLPVSLEAARLVIQLGLE
jgi:hypothetical protein